MKDKIYLPVIISCRSPKNQEKTNLIIIYFYVHKLIKIININQFTKNYFRVFIDFG